MLPVFGLRSWRIHITANFSNRPREEANQNHVFLLFFCNFSLSSSSNVLYTFQKSKAFQFTPIQKTSNNPLHLSEDWSGRTCRTCPQQGILLQFQQTQFQISRKKTNPVAVFLFAGPGCSGCLFCNWAVLQAFHLCSLRHRYRF